MSRWIRASDYYRGVENVGCDLMDIEPETKRTQESGWLQALDTYDAFADDGGLRSDDTASDEPEERAAILRMLAENAQEIARRRLGGNE